MLISMSHGYLPFPSIEGDVSQEIHFTPDPANSDITLEYKPALNRKELRRVYVILDKNLKRVATLDTTTDTNIFWGETIQQQLPMIILQTTALPKPV